MNALVRMHFCGDPFEPSILLYVMIVTKSHELTQIYSISNTMKKQRKLTEIKWIDTYVINIKYQNQVSPFAGHAPLKDQIHYNSNGYMFKHFSES